MLRAINSADCESSDTTVVQILDQPVVGLPDTHEFCQGEIGLLEVQDANVTSVTWYRGQEVIDGETGLTLEVDMPGEYRVVAGEGLDCNDEATTTVSFLESPDISLLQDTEFCSGETVELTAGMDGAFDYLWTDTDGNTISTGDAGTITVTTSGTYTVVASNAAECETTLSTTLDFLEAPTVDVPDMPLSFCDNEDAIIEGMSSAMSVTWLLDGMEQPETDPQLMVSVSGEYTMIAGAGTRCEVRDSVMVTINEAPIVDLTEEFIICQGLSETIDAGDGAGLSYEWSIDGMAIDNMGSTLEISEALISGSGVVTVDVTNGDNCISSSSTNVEFVEAPMISLDDELNICSGETAMIELMSSVNTVNWYFEGALIQGQNGVTLDASQPGTYVAIAAEGQMCEARDSVELIAIDAPILDLGGALIEECAGEQVLLTLMSDVDADVTWTENGTTNDTERGTTLLVNTDGVYTATVENDEGCATTVSQEVRFFEFASASLGDLPMGECEGREITVEAMSDGTRYEWLDTDGDAIPGATSLQQTFSESGDYTFVAYNEIDCPTEVSFSLEFIPAPTVDLGSDVARICQGETIELGTEEEMNVTYIWSRDGEILQGETSSTLSVSETGLYELLALNDIDCETRGSVDVTVVEFPSLQSEDEAAYCEGSDVRLEIMTSGTMITWTLNNQTVGSDVTNLVVSEAGLYEVEVTTPEGCAVTTTIDVSQIVLPEVSLDDQALCPGDDAVTLTVPDVFDNYEWTGGSGNPADENYTIEYQSVNSVTTETITFVGSDNNGCSVTDQFTVTFQAPVVAEALIPGFEICIGQEVQLGVTEGFDYSWTDPNGSLNSTTVSNPLAAPSETTTYEVSVTGICPADEVVIPITVEVNPLPEADAGSDRDVLADRPFNLSASGGVLYQWDNEDLILGSSDIDNPEVVLTEETTFTVTVTDENGCVAIDDVTIFINSDPGTVVTTVNTFTPNGDLINDFLEFEGLEIFELVNLTVFNRWGNVVFEKRQYQIDGGPLWDGTRRGEPLPADTYYYILEFDDFIHKSSLTIIRD